MRFNTCYAMLDRDRTPIEPVATLSSSEYIMTRPPLHVTQQEDVGKGRCRRGRENRERTRGRETRRETRTRPVGERLEERQREDS